MQERKNIRWKGFDYTSVCYYFITVDVQKHQHLLGTIDNGEMRLNDAGQMVQEVIQRIPEQFKGTEIGKVVIMPNHIHLLLFNGGGFYMPDIMRWFKSVTTNYYIHGVKEHGWKPFFHSLWLRTFFDRVVRNQQELANIAQYIDANPQRWAERRNNDECGDDRQEDGGNGGLHGCGRTRGYAHTDLGQV